MAKGGKGRKGGGGGGGKTRKYTRDNNGRFASTGTGATARGGRLLTAKGNKRKTQTMEAGGAKAAGTIKGKLKRDPGAASKVAQRKAAAPSTKAKSPKFVTEQSGRVRRAALGGGRTAIVRANSATIINAKGEPIMTRKGLPNITAGKKWAANPNARGPRLMRNKFASEAAPSRDFARTSRSAGTTRKPRGTARAAAGTIKGKLKRDPAAAGKIGQRKAAAKPPAAKRSAQAESNRGSAADRKERAKLLSAMPKEGRRAVQTAKTASRQRRAKGQLGVGIEGRRGRNTDQSINSVNEGSTRLRFDAGKRKSNPTKLTEGQRALVARSMAGSANSLKARMKTTAASKRTKAFGGTTTRRQLPGVKGTIKKQTKPPTAKPTTQKERWAARAKMLNNAADKNDAKAKRLRDANDTTGNTAFNTQPGKIPGRARMNAASERSFRMNEKAAQQRARAENLQRMATTNKGDAAKGYAARAEQVKASYGGIKKGTIVESIMGPGGPATVIRANAKSVTMKMSDGRIMNEPYERLKLKSPTLGSSKVVDGAKVSRMAARLGAKSRAPKSSSPVKNANTVAVRAKAISFLTGKGGTFPNAAAASASMAANIRNRPVFSTGKKATAKPSVPAKQPRHPKAK